MKPPKGNTASPPPETTSVRALLVDDSPVMLQALTGFFARDHRFRVVGTAVDGRQALLAAASLNPQLVLVDLHLPHLNGAEVTRCLKQFEDPPVVFMVTSDDSTTSRALSAAAGADAFLLKSSSLPGQLESKLQEWFGPDHSPRVRSDASPPCSASGPATRNSGPAR